MFQFQFCPFSKNQTTSCASYSLANAESTSLCVLDALGTHFNKISVTVIEFILWTR